LYEEHGGVGYADSEQVAAELEKILGASAVVYANSVEMIESEPDELPYWLR
jgi:hypothetical protein